MPKSNFKWGKIGLGICLSLGSLSVYSIEDKIKFWENENGLIKLNRCHISSEKHSGFGVISISNEFIDLYNNEDEKSLAIGNNALIKFDQIKSNQANITLIGKNTIQNKEVNWAAERNDMGLINKNLIDSISEKVISIENEMVDFNYIKTFKEEGEYLTVTCQREGLGERSYLVFAAFENLEDISSADSYIGISVNETALLSNSVLAEKSLAFAEKTLEFESERNYFLSYFGQKIKLNTQQELEETKSVEEELLETEILQVEKDKDQVEVVDGLTNIVCVQNGTLNVRDEKLENVIFRARSGERLNIFQNFSGPNSKNITLGGRDYDFVKVSFYEREDSGQRVGWVASDFIEAENQCVHIPANSDIDKISDTDITGLDDEKCCEFPTVKQATHPYTKGMQMFGARRGGGTRAHAATDIYRFEHEPILAVAPGKIVRGLYYFYQGTYAIEVVHSGGFVVRYGEINGRRPEKTANGNRVQMGQRIGYMGVVNSGCCRPMLHFELYSGELRGPLSQSGNTRFNRRSDLMNPTPYLLRWESEKF